MTCGPDEPSGEARVCEGRRRDVHVARYAGAHLRTGLSRLASSGHCGNWPLVMRRGGSRAGYNATTAKPHCAPAFESGELPMFSDGYCGYQREKLTILDTTTSFCCSAERFRCTVLDISAPRAG